MGRLIDTDHALQRFIKEAEASGTGCIHINTIKRLLQDIDTAYDVEKVVTELAEMCKQTYYNAVEGNRDEGIRNNVYHKAIDIVKDAVMPAAVQESESLKMIKYGEAARKGIEDALSDYEAGKDGETK